MPGEFLYFSSTQKQMGDAMFFFSVGFVCVVANLCIGRLILYIYLNEPYQRTGLAVAFRFTAVRFLY